MCVCVYIHTYIHTHTHTYQGSDLRAIKGNYLQNTSKWNSPCS